MGQEDHSHLQRACGSARPRIAGRDICFQAVGFPRGSAYRQIYDKDEKHLIGTVLAVPDERLEPRGKTVISFDERPSVSPEALRAWFYPGNTVGQEFVYPHNRAKEIARRSGQHVLSMRGDDVSSDALSKGDYGAVQPSGEDVDIEKVHKHK